MVICVAGPPRFHASSCEAAAFLSERINRVTITGRYLGRGSDLIASEAEGCSDVHDVSTVTQRKFSEQTKEMCSGVSLTWREAAEV